MAVDGLTLKSRISIGVISAPPPAPVSPTRKPTKALPQHDVGIDIHRCPPLWMVLIANQAEPLNVVFLQCKVYGVTRVPRRSSRRPWQ